MFKYVPILQVRLSNPKHVCHKWHGSCCMCGMSPKYSVKRGDEIKARSRVLLGVEQDQDSLSGVTVESQVNPSLARLNSGLWILLLYIKLWQLRSQGRVNLALASDTTSCAPARGSWLSSSISLLNEVRGGQNTACGPTGWIQSCPYSALHRAEPHPLQPGQPMLLSVPAGLGPDQCMQLPVWLFLVLFCSPHLQ